MLKDPYDRSAFNFLYGAAGGDPAKIVVADTASWRNSQVIDLKPGAIGTGGDAYRPAFTQGA